MKDNEIIVNAIKEFDELNIIKNIILIGENGAIRNIELDNGEIYNLKKDLEELKILINSGSLDYTKCKYCDMVIKDWMKAQDKIKQIINKIK